VGHVTEAEKASMQTVLHSTNTQSSRTQFQFISA